MSNDDAALEEMLGKYRAACPEPEASPNFMAELWSKIEARHGFLFAFGRLARTGTAVAAAFCLFLIVLNFSAGNARMVSPTYADALAADSQARALYGGRGLARAVLPSEGNR